MMKASEGALGLIRKYEGLRVNAYRCPSGVWTIGYGHTGKDVRQGQTITAEKAEELLRADVAVFEAELNRMASAAGVALRQNQFDALVSFAFNVGIGNLRSSTLWRKVKADANDTGIALEFSRWIYGTSGGKKVQLPGLVKRRAEEARMYAG